MGLYLYCLTNCYGFLNVLILLIYFFKKVLYVYFFIAKKTLFNNHLSLFFEPAKKSDGKETPLSFHSVRFVIATQESKIVNSNLRFSNNSVRFSCCNFSCVQIKWCCAFLTKFSLHNKFIHYVNAWE